MTSSPLPPTPPNAPRPEQAAAQAVRSGVGSGTNVEKSLIGRLPCVGCGYNLQGLSVVGVCPECGAAVRATILAIIDPMAEALRPVLHPRATAVGIILWAVGGFGAALVACYALAVAIVPGTILGLGRSHFPLWSPVTVQILAVISALGSMGFIRPHRGVGMRVIFAGLIAVAAYVPLVHLLGVLLSATATAALSSNVDPWQLGGGGAAASTRFTVLRIAMHGLILAIIGGLRPGARLLVARSLALRTGRVDRQTMMAMAAAVLLSIVGDLLGLLGTNLSGGTADSLKIAGVVLMIVGGSLLVLGLAGSVVDCARIARAIIVPAPSLRQVLDDDDDSEPATIGGGQ